LRCPWSRYVVVSVDVLCWKEPDPHQKVDAKLRQLRKRLVAGERRDVAGRPERRERAPSNLDGLDGRVPLVDAPREPRGGDGGGGAAGSTRASFLGGRPRRGASTSSFVTATAGADADGAAGSGAGVTGDEASRPSRSGWW